MELEFVVEVEYVNAWKAQCALLKQMLRFETQISDKLAYEVLAQREHIKDLTQQRDGLVYQQNSQHVEILILEKTTSALASMVRNEADRRHLVGAKLNALQIQIENAMKESGV